jgi:hypothetical protein
MNAKPFYICAALSVILLSGCSREEVPEPENSAPSQSSSVQPVLPESVTISAERGSASLTAAARAEIAAADGRLIVRATGEDPQLTFGIAGASGRATAVYVDIETPAAGALELFYHVENVPFSSDHVLSTPTKPGRNRILLQINDPRFSGWLRLDPGQTAGEYAIHSITVFSDRPLSVIAPLRPQAELRAAFDASTTSLFATRSGESFAAFQPQKEIKLQPTAEGLLLNATGPDASLLLPEFDATQPSIIKIVIVSPAETMLQVFFKVTGQTEYTEAHSRSRAVAAGENVIYLEQSEPTTPGLWRFDPGMTPGAYLLKEIEVRAVKTDAP